jgi:hypothetical protein
MRKLLFVALAAAALAGPVHADPVTEALFAEGIFDGQPDGQEIAYSHARSGNPAADFQPVVAGRILLVTEPAQDGRRSLSLTIESEGRQREIVDFPASGGNPVLMVFLESTVRSMAALTGGSPFYIRNRIKDALRQGGQPVDLSQDSALGQVAAREVVLHPFADDPNRDRMGAFADLALRFVVADAVPGRLVLLSADTPDPASGYHETIALTGAGGDQ